MPETFSPPPRVSVMHVPSCMPGSLTSGFLWSRWRRKHSRHSRRMCNPQYYVSGKRPMGVTLLCNIICLSVRITNYDFLNCAVAVQLYQIKSFLIVTSAPRQQWLPGKISICKILLYSKTALLDSFAEFGILSGILYVHHKSAKVIDATIQRSQRNSLRYQRIRGNMRLSIDIIQFPIK